MIDLTIKQYDLDEPVRATLLDNGVAVNLTGYDVYFVFSSNATAPVFRRVCVVEDAAAGKVRYDWQAGDTATAGFYFAEFEAVAQATGTRKTYPSSDYIRVQVVAGLGDS